MGFDITKILPGGSLLSDVKDIIGAFKLDPAKKAEIEAAMDDHAWAFKMKEQEIRENADKAVTEAANAQVELDKLDAQGTLYQSSWRPTIGYICALGLLFEFFIRPLMAWGSGIWGWPAPPPLDMGDLITVLLGMLGLAKLRSDEKRAGVA